MQLTNEQEVLDLIYSNGANNPARIQFHEDSGHGWMQTPKKLLIQLGIETQISGYSYEDEFNAYLEEDCDMSILFNALGVDYKNRPMFELFWSHVPRNYTDGSSRIRNFAQYQAPKQTQPQQAKLF